MPIFPLIDIVFVKGSAQLRIPTGDSWRRADGADHAVIGRRSGRLESAEAAAVEDQRRGFDQHGPDGM